MRGLRWVSAHGHLNVQSLGARPVEGGRESDGTPLYIAKAFHKGAEHPGKASEKLHGKFSSYRNVSCFDLKSTSSRVHPLRRN